MSVFCPLHCSRHQFSPRIATTLAITQCPTLRLRSRKATGVSQCSQDDRHSQWKSKPNPELFTEGFIRSLVIAGPCQHHDGHGNRKLTALKRPSPRSHLVFRGKPPASRFYSTLASREQGAAVAIARTARDNYPFSRDELRSLIDTYSVSLDDQILNVTEINNVPVDPPPQTEPHVVTKATRKTVSTLKRQLRQSNAPAEELFSTYQQLPYPGASYLPGNIRHALLARLSHVPRSSESTLLRYSKVFEDMKLVQGRIMPHEWTTLIALTGRAFRNITAGDVENSLHIWREMETTAGITSTSITFAVLYDIAIKSNRFVLADMIREEMEKRKLPFNTFFRTKLIRGCGFRGDGDGVRREYRALVDSGCIVNTEVVACVISSLIKCRETGAAEQTFERSKELHASKGGRALVATHWEERHEIGLELDRMTQKHAGDRGKLKQIQDTVSLAPGAATYRALVEHHTLVTGDINRVAQLVGEMRDFDLPLQGVIFLYLFRGFVRFGGKLYTSWTQQRLENTWSAFVASVNRQNDDGTPAWRDPSEFGSENDIYISPSLAIVTLKAFAKCCGEKRTKEVWKEMIETWRPGHHDVESIERELACSDYIEWEFGDEGAVAVA